MKQVEAAINKPFTLPPVESWDETPYFLRSEPAYAIIAAVYAKRPLLVCGEPGVGKSVLARAAAKLLGREFISTVIQPNSSYDDLLWSFDHTSRLADAQLKDKESVNNPKNYMSPGILWYAYDWETASEMKCNNSFQPSQGQTAKTIEEKGLVVLLDEIDKADISLANGLLEVLGNNGFRVPPLNIDVPPKMPKEENKENKETDKPRQTPLIVLTSNNTRELPDALRRRCVVLNITLPKEHDALSEHLITLGKTHFPELNHKVHKRVAQQIISDRKKCHGSQKTGQAEYLDLLRALSHITNRKDEQLEWLDKISDCFKKS